MVSQLSTPGELSLIRVDTYAIGVPGLKVSKTYSEAFQPGINSNPAPKNVTPHPKPNPNQGTEQPNRLTPDQTDRIWARDGARLKVSLGQECGRASRLHPGLRVLRDYSLSWGLIGMLCFTLIGGNRVKGSIF